MEGVDGSRKGGGLIDLEKRNIVSHKRGQGVRKTNDDICCYFVVRLRYNLNLHQGV